jgi:type IV pilus assembly protein PilC
MPKYIYLAKTKEARTIKDVEEVSSKEELISRLRARGLYIVSVKEVKEEKRPKEFLVIKKGKRSSIKAYDLALFARNLSTTLSSGVTLLRSLEVIANQTESASLEKILKNCIEDVRGGLSLSEAITKYPKVFSSLWQGIVEVGEASGNLPFVLERLADYLEMRIEFERKIKSALIYPSMLMFAIVFALLFFLKFVLPKFTSLFTQFNITLPLPTQIVFKIGSFFEKNFLLIILGILLLIILFFSFRKNPQTKQFWDKINFKLPILGKLIFISCLERLASTIYILLDSGLPLVYTLEVAAKATNHTFLEKDLLFVKEKVREGASLSNELKKINIFPLLISEMAKIGEETGSMPEVFKKISLYYQKELTTKVERLIAAFEPLMILFMGIIIGGIVVSLFLPLFKIATLGRM